MDPVEGGLWDQDERGRPNVTGLTENVVAVPILCIRPGGKFVISAPQKSAQHWYRRTVVEFQPSPCGRASDVPCVFSEISGSLGVPSRGITGKGSDKDGDTHALCAPPRVGNHDHNGGQPPPPMMSLL